MITLSAQFGSFTPFYVLRKIIYEVTFPEHYPIVREEMEIFPIFCYPVSDR